MSNKLPRLISLKRNKYYIWYGLRSKELSMICLGLALLCPKVLLSYKIMTAFLVQTWNVHIFIMAQQEFLSLLLKWSNIVR